MATIKVRSSSGKITEYKKPDHCPISDDVWSTPLGYCWGFATNQDNGDKTCTCSSSECYML